MADTLLALEAVREPVLYASGAVALAVLAAAVAVFLLPRRGTLDRTLRVAVGSLLPLVAAIPAASILMFVAVPRPPTKGAAVTAYVISCVLLWSSTLTVAVWRGRRSAMLALCGLTVGLVLLDQWLGGPWTYTGFVTYSPLQAKRFYGLGNEGAAALAGAALVGLGLAFDAFASRRWAATLRRWGPLALGFVTVGTAAAPFLGANVTVAAWGTVGFGVLWVLSSGRRLGWRDFVAGGLLVLALLAALVFADRLLGSGTHLAASWDALASGRVSELAGILGRKAAINVRVFFYTPGSLALVVLVALLAWFRWRPGARGRALWAEEPGLAAAVWATLAAALAAFFTEDSGIVMVALTCVYPGVAVLWLLLAEDAPGPPPAEEGVVAA